MEFLTIMILLYNYNDKYRILFSQCTFDCVYIYICVCGVFNSNLNIEMLEPKIIIC